MHTRDVCEDCNNGWMSAMEQAARPVILQLAQAGQSGLAIAVSREHARELAAWAQKTALAYELATATGRVGTVAMGQEVRAGRRCEARRSGPPATRGTATWGLPSLRSTSAQHRSPSRDRPTAGR